MKDLSISRPGRDGRSSSSTTTWTLVVTSVAAFMVSLDNLVVTIALPTIRTHLHASLESLEWTVNAYTLTFAVLLLTGATLGERFGRRRVFVAGMALFTISSAAAALAPSIGALVAARAVQGAGAAIVLPLTLTLLSAAVPPERRGAALGLWGAMAGLAVALGPLVGGAVTEGASWQWIFWLNVPIGIAVLPLAARYLARSGPTFKRIDGPGVALVSFGLLGVVFGLVRGNGHGWTSLQVLGSILVGAVLLSGFVMWERRAREPMLPLALFRRRGFSATNAASFLFSAGMFGSIFLLSQFLQTVQHYSPLQTGLRTLPWTAMPLLVAPIAGPLSDRIGGRPLLVLGLSLQSVGLAWLAIVTSTTVSYASLVLPFIISGVGMALFFVPVANTVLGSVEPEQEGVASGANNGFRELGGVFGIAVLSSVFSARGGFTSAASFVHGLTGAVWVGVIILVGSVAAAIAIPRRKKVPSG
ncbi:MAG: DHA2 family efflux MFS transporter permease subunit [Acidimicrobiales bacterium]